MLDSKKFKGRPTGCPGILLSTIGTSTLASSLNGHLHSSFMILAPFLMQRPSKFQQRSEIWARPVPLCSSASPDLSRRHHHPSHRTPIHHSPLHRSAPSSF